MKTESDNILTSHSMKVTRSANRALRLYFSNTSYAAVLHLSLNLYGSFDITSKTLLVWQLTQLIQLLAQAACFFSLAVVPVPPAYASPSEMLHRQNKCSSLSFCFKVCRCCRTPAFPATRALSARMRASSV